MEGLPEWFIQNLTAEELVEACRPTEPVSSAFVSSVSSEMAISRYFGKQNPEKHDFDETLANIWNFHFRGRKWGSRP